jgi:hypothetical protein
MHTRGPAKIESEEPLKRRIYELECQLRQKEEEIINVRIDLSKEIQRLNCELHAMRLLLNAKQERLGRSK